MGCSSPKNVNVPIPFNNIRSRNNVRPNFNLKECLSFNSNSALFNAIDRKSGNLYFMRVYSINSKENAEKAIQKILRICAQQAIFTNILPYENDYISEHYYYLTMKNPNYMSFLDSLINQTFELTEAGICYAFKGLFKTLFEMHKSGIFHGQITPDKLFLNNNQIYIYDVTSGLENNADLLINNKSYIAPEILEGGKIGPDSDVWSIGSIIFYILAGHTIYQPIKNSVYMQNSEINEINFDADPIWHRISSELLTLVRKMLIKDPKKRISMKQILEDRWITEIAPLRKEYLIGYSDFIQKDTISKHILSKTVSVLANEASKTKLNELNEKINSLDFEHTKYCSLYLLLSNVLDSQNIFMQEIENNSLNINYSLIIENSKLLNQFILEERYAVLFYALSKNEKYLSEEKIKKVLYNIQTSVIVSSPKKFSNMIKAYQEKERKEVNLTYTEFVKYFSDLDFNIDEELLYNSCNS